MISRQATGFVLSGLGLLSIALTLHQSSPRLGFYSPSLSNPETESLRPLIPIPTPPPPLPTPTLPPSPTPTPQPEGSLAVSSLSVHQTILSVYLYALQQAGSPLTDEHILISDAQGNPLAQYGLETRIPTAGWEPILNAQTLLRTGGVDQRFQTHIYSNGTIQDGVLTGDMVITGADPYFDKNDAVELAEQLNGMDIHTITGTLRVGSGFVMAGERDPLRVGTMLRDSWQTMAQGRDGTPHPLIAVNAIGQALPSDPSNPPHLIITHTSFPLRAVLTQALAGHRTLPATPVAAELSLTQLLALMRDPDLMNLLPEVGLNADPHLSELPMGMHFSRFSTPTGWVGLGSLPDGRRLFIHSGQTDQTFFLQLLRDIADFS